MITFVYAVLVFQVLRFSVTLFNFLSNPKLGYYGKRFTDKISIIITISQRSENTTELQLSLEKQDYNNIEVFVKHSLDDETKIVERTTGRYLLFLDVNTIVHKGLINNMIYRTKVFNLALLTLIPNKKFKGFLEWCIYPLSDFVLMNIFPLRLMRLTDQQAFVTANEACMFFDAELYRRSVEKTNGKNLTGVEMAKAMKQMGLKTEVLLANKFIYSDNTDIETLGKELLQILGNNILTVLLYIVLVIAGPVVMLINFEINLIALPFGLIFLSRVMISFLTAQNPGINILLHPLQMVMLFVILLKTGWNKVLNK